MAEVLIGAIITHLFQPFENVSFLESRLVELACPGLEGSVQFLGFALEPDRLVNRLAGDVQHLADRFIGVMTLAEQVDQIFLSRMAFGLYQVEGFALGVKGTTGQGKVHIVLQNLDQYAEKGGAFHPGDGFEEREVIELFIRGALELWEALFLPIGNPTPDDGCISPTEGSHVLHDRSVRDLIH